MYCSVCGGRKIPGLTCCAPRPMFTCTNCDRQYPSNLAALDCADQDELEADDRTHSRLYGIHRGTD